MPFDPSRIKLGRHIEHDERNRDYGTAIRDGRRLVSTFWQAYGALLDQLDVGSCTGEAGDGWLGCAPGITTTADAAQYDQKHAIKIYTLATELDNIPGSYPEQDTGSTGNAAAKAMRQLGDIRSWSWAFTTTGLLSALQSGPVMIGTAWTRSMFHPDASGFIHPTGNVMGGHEYLVHGVHLGPTPGDQWLICRNSWGDWGPLGDGRFLLRLSDWEILRRQGADVTIPHR
jgi:hypothetical protein